MLQLFIIYGTSTQIYGLLIFIEFIDVIHFFFLLNLILNFSKVQILSIHLSKKSLNHNLFNLFGMASLDVSYSLITFVLLINFKYVNIIDRDYIHYTIPQSNV